MGLGWEGVTALDAGGPVGSFEVGVAVVAVEEGTVGTGGRDGERGGTLPGYDDASGLKFLGRRAADRPPALVVKGGEAVRVATEAIAGQIGLAAERIAAAIEAQTVAAPEPGELGLESVQVSFGITLAAGVQALFTAQAESSAQVSITLARRPATDG
jgi:hypothetical protein